MMKLKRAILKTFMAVSLLLASCSHFNSQFMVYEEQDYVFQDYIAVKAILANYRAVMNDSNELHSSQSKARLIRPDINAGEYDFYIYGQKNINDTSSLLGPFNISDQLEEGDSGTFEISVPKGIWYMTLIAVTNGESFSASDIPNVSSKARLWGTTVTDLNSDAPNTNFILSDAGLTTSGTVDLHINLDSWELTGGIHVKGGLYYIKSGLEVENTVQEISFTKTGDITSGTYTPPAGNINPGSYVFKLIFYDPLNSIFTYQWTDYLHIYPGSITNGNITIPSLINNPDAPSDFTVTYGDSAAENFLSSDEMYYTCNFSWTDNTQNENGFEIKLVDLCCSDSEEVYSTDIIAKQYLHVSGDLYSVTGTGGTGQLSARVKLGHKLKAYIRAINNSGASEWVATTDDKTINQYRIRFNFNGGSNSNKVTLNNGIGDIEASKLSDSYSFYGSVGSANSIELITLDNNKKVYISENGETKYFTGWGSTPVSSENVTQISADITNNYQNIDLWAQYKYSAPTSSNGSEEKQEQNLETRLKKYLTLNSHKPVSNDFTSNNTTLSYKNTDTVTCELKNNVRYIKTLDSDTFEYEYMRISIKNISSGRILKEPVSGKAIESFEGIGDRIKDSAIITIPIDLTGLTTGTYEMFIEARPEKTNDIISTSLYFKITE